MKEKSYILDYTRVDAKNIRKEYDLLGLNYMKFFKMDDFCKLGYIAAAKVLKNRESLGDDTALLMGTHSSSLSTDIVFQKTINKADEYFPSPSIFVYTLPNIVLGEIAIAFKLTNENICYVAENIETLELESKIDQIFRYTDAKRLLFVWIECSDHLREAFALLVQKEETKISCSNRIIKKIYDNGRID